MNMQSLSVLMCMVLTMKLSNSSIAQIATNCDNEITVYYSSNNGDTYTMIGHIVPWWSTLKLKQAISNPMASILKFECKNYGGGAGAFIAQINYDSKTYYTDVTNNNYFTTFDGECLLDPLETNHPQTCGTMQNIKLVNGNPWGLWHPEIVQNYDSNSHWIWQTSFGDWYSHSTTFTYYFIFKQSITGFNTKYSISGFSSGGCMAQKHSIAFSNDIIGVGIFACSVIADTKTTIEYSNIGRIDNYQNIASQKVYVFGGRRDTHVNSTIARQSLTEYYNAFGNTPEFKELGAEHTMVTDLTLPSSWQDDCINPQWPWIANCNFDLAGNALQYIYSNGLESRIDNISSLSSDNLATFPMEIQHFVPDATDPLLINMADYAYYYRASGCSIHPLSVECRLHVVYHGCGQNALYLYGNTYPKYTGYNNWAETNKFVILYPQTSNSSLGCWDFGYPSYNTDSYLSKTGKQLATINNMIQWIFDDDDGDDGLSINIDDDVNYYWFHDFKSNETNIAILLGLVFYPAICAVLCWYISKKSDSKNDYECISESGQQIMQDL